MNKKRISGLVVFVIGFIILAGAFISAGGIWFNIQQNGLAFTALFVGAPLVLVGFLNLVLPERMLQSKREKIGRLEKRVAQLERERKNSP